MSLFPIVDGRARFDASGNVASDRYAAGIRFTQEGAARSQTSAGTNFNQGIPMSESGQVSLVDASSGLPADVVWLSGLPISGNRVCISNKPVSVVSSGIPYDSAGAVAATVAPITTLPTLDLVFAGTATDPLDAATTADDTLGLNFVSEAYQIAAQYAVWGTGGLQQVNFADIVTFTRASTGTFFNSAGTLTTAAINEARFDYNPSTLAAQGLLIEEQRTNSIRNNTMQGAVAGTPGTLPTNWVQSALAAGLTANVLGTGTSNGITYIDIRISGTTADTIGWSVFTDANTQIAASSGQVWAGSSYVAIIGGSTANITAGLVRVVERNSGGGYIAESNTSWAAATATLANNRFSVARTLGGTAAFVQFGVYFQANSGVAIDITLRIGLPQLEQGAFATSVIPTTTTALTRSADVASVNTLSPWYNQTEGTVYAELQSLSPLTAAQSVALNKYPNVWCIDAGTSDSSVIWYGVGAEMFISGTYNNIGTVPSGVNKFAVALAASGNQSSSSLNGAVAVNRSGSLSVTATQFTLGRDPGGTQVLNGYLRRITYYPRRLPNADLQTITA